MKIACIGDVHANIQALRAVLKDIKARGIKTIWNIGDFVGYGPDPQAVVQTIARGKIPSVVGNYDLKVLDIRSDARLRQGKNPQKLLAFEWAHDQLSDASRRYLAALPRELRFNVQGKRVLLTHASPADIEEHLLPNTPAGRMSQLAKLAKADLVVFGHSHQPFVRLVEGTWFVNTGSVGRPEGDPRTCYALVTIDKKGIQVRHVRLKYDVQAAAGAIRKAGLPEDFAQMLLQGKKLDDLKPQPSKKKPKPQPELTDVQKLAMVRKLAANDRYYEHAQHVSHLALCLFDELQKVHKLGPQQRLLLQYAGLLHDIGWAQGRRGHHKATMRMILDDPELPFTPQQRLIVGNIARYHRKAMPTTSHAPFAALDRDVRPAVRMLAGILRFADGLDVEHTSLVKNVRCTVGDKKITVAVHAARPPAAELEKAAEKSDLLQSMLKQPLKIEWQKIP